GQNLLKILGDLGVIPNAPVPNVRAGTAAYLDFGKTIEGGANIRQIRICAQIEFLQIAALKAEAFQGREPGNRDVLQVGAVETFDRLKASEAGKIKGVGDGVVGGTPVAQAGQWIRKAN